MREKCTAQRGFTLIELLVVIAIIAILAAILFPAFNAVREKTRQTTCMSQMHSVWQALRSYREDMGVYPPVLCANPYYLDTTSNPPKQVLYDGAAGHVPLDIDQVLKRPLTKLRSTVSGKQTFLCPDNVNPNPTAVSTAVYPPNVPLSGTVMLNGAAEYFYTYDSYDIGPALDTNNQATPPYTYEVHYALNWTGPSGANDPPNQLKYPNPPESSTVVTWCTYHCAVNHSNIIPVMLLSGTMKAAQANQFTSKGPLNYRP